MTLVNCKLLKSLPFELKCNVKIQCKIVANLYFFFCIYRTCLYIIIIYNLFYFLGMWLHTNPSPQTVNILRSGIQNKLTVTVRVKCHVLVLVALTCRSWWLTHTGHSLSQRNEYPSHCNDTKLTGKINYRMGEKINYRKNEINISMVWLLFKVTTVGKVW